MNLRKKHTSSTAEVIIRLRTKVRTYRKNQREDRWAIRKQTTEAWCLALSKGVEPSRYALELMGLIDSCEMDKTEAPSQYYTQPKTRLTAHEPDDWQQEQIQEKLGLGEYGCLPSQHIMFQH